MEFQVPQFIEVEDKIFGPFTLKQFIFIIGGLGLGFIIWNILSPFLGIFIPILISLPITAFISAFGFNILHDREMFINTVENGFKFYKNKKVYIWRKTKNRTEKGDRASDSLGDNDNIENMVPKLSNSKLKDLSWGLDVQETLVDSTQDSAR
jgi:hypothetical protein